MLIELVTGHFFRRAKQSHTLRPGAPRRGIQSREKVPLIRMLHNHRGDGECRVRRALDARARDNGRHSRHASEKKRRPAQVSAAAACRGRGRQALVIRPGGGMPGERGPAPYIDKICAGPCREERRPWRARNPRAADWRPVARPRDNNKLASAAAPARESRGTCRRARTPRPN